MRNRLKNAGLHGRVARKRSYISPINRSKRTEFAKQYQDQPWEFWKTVIWSDESKFELLSNKRRQTVWRKNGTAFDIKHITPTVKHGVGSVMMWGCFSYYGLGNIIFIGERWTSVRYVQLSKENLFTSASRSGMKNNFVFQQGNDPKHRSKVAQQFFESQRVPLLSWPPQSPDLNPIEHLSDELDRLIAVSKRSNKNIFRTAPLEALSLIHI